MRNQRVLKSVRPPAYIPSMVHSYSSPLPMDVSHVYILPDAIHRQWEQRSAMEEFETTLSDLLAVQAVGLDSMGSEQMKRKEKQQNCEVMSRKVLEPDDDTDLQDLTLNILLSRVTNLARKHTSRRLWS